MNQHVWKRRADDPHHPLTSSPLALQRQASSSWIASARRNVALGLGIAKDAYDEVMACFGAAVECGDDFARSAIRFRRKLARRFAGASPRDPAPRKDELATVATLGRPASAAKAA